MKLQLVPNWQKMHKSLAVWFPVIATGAIEGARYALDMHIIPQQYTPAVVLVTGFVGRIIKQKSISGE